jgi:hypothetical protein
MGTPTKGGGSDAHNGPGEQTDGAGVKKALMTNIPPSTTPLHPWTEIRAI